MIGPWQLLALRENETAMDVSYIRNSRHLLQLFAHVVFLTLSRYGQAYFSNFNSN